MTYRVVTYEEKHGEYFEAVLEDDSPDGNWIDLKGGMQTKFHETIRNAFEHRMRIMLVPVAS